MVRSRNKFKRTPLPTLLLSNVNRLFNKTDELCEKLKLKEYKSCQALCLTETWLKDSHPDSLISPPGFTPFRCDRDPLTTNKSCGGGIVFLINQEWCKNVKVISKTCTNNLEQITIKCRPFYLPREISSITLTGVYIHPRADTNEALSDLCTIISDNENKDPDTSYTL